MTFAFLQNMGPWQIIICIVVIALLFGGKKIPELMNGLGKGVKSFKKGLNEVEDEIKQIDVDLEKGTDTKKDK